MTKYLETIFRIYNLKTANLIDLIKGLELVNEQVKAGKEISTFDAYIKLRAKLKISYGINRIPRNNDAHIKIARSLI